MEHLLHYTWKHRLFPLQQLQTTDGQSIEVISVGTHNADAGPDFTGAQIKIGDMMWAGNIEIHTRSSDWYRHNHDVNAAYDGVVLHVVEDADTEVYTSKGTRIPQLKMAIPHEVRTNYEQLVHSDKHPRCRAILPTLPQILITSWLATLSIERLMWRTKQIMTRHKQCEYNWEDITFVTVARNFGFGKNGDAFEQWALSIPKNAIAKHRDDLFQIEAIFFGQAGLLDEIVVNDYRRRLKSEYEYLQRKFSLRPIDPVVWKFMRTRPQNFPHVRIAQLAQLYCKGSFSLARMINAPSMDNLLRLFDVEVSEYWKTHYSFSTQATREHDKNLSISSKKLIILNSVIPLMFAYGKYQSNDKLVNCALELLTQLKPEQNYIISLWQEAGIECSSAADTQALLQLTRHYCEAKDCLQCRFGYEYIRSNPGYLNEENGRRDR